MLLSSLSTEKLFDFFHDRVMTVSNRTGHPQLSDDTRLYLTTLLLDSVRQDKQPFPDITTLTELHLQAVQATREQDRARIYRVLGDRALLTVGWFPHSLDRKIVNQSFYVGMGSGAYHRSHQWMHRVFGEVFQQLAVEFEECAEILDAARPRDEMELAMMRVPAVS